MAFIFQAILFLRLLNMLDQHNFCWSIFLWFVIISGRVFGKEAI